MASKISIFGALIIIIIFIMGIHLILNTKIDLFSRSVTGAIKISPENASIYEARYLWRERLYDTLFQSLVLVTALAGVLIYVTGVRKR